MQEIYGRRLAIRARYAHNKKILGRMSIERIGYLSIKPLSRLIDKASFQGRIELIVEKEFLE